MVQLLYYKKYPTSAVLKYVHCDNYRSWDHHHHSPDRVCQNHSIAFPCPPQYSAETQGTCRSPLRAAARTKCTTVHAAPPGRCGRPVWSVTDCSPLLSQRCGRKPATIEGRQNNSTNSTRPIEPIGSSLSPAVGSVCCGWCVARWTGNDDGSTGGPWRGCSLVSFVVVVCCCWK